MDHGLTIQKILEPAATLTLAMKAYVLLMSLLFTECLHTLLSLQTECVIMILLHKKRGITDVIYFGPINSFSTFTKLKSQHLKTRFDFYQPI